MMREFSRLKSLAIIILLVIGMRIPIRQQSNGNYLFTFAQITDSHIGFPNSALILQNVTNWLAHQENIVFVVHTGDIVENCWKPEEWKEANKIMHTLDPHCNWTALAGNHDVQHGDGAPVNLRLYKQYFGDDAVNTFNVVNNRLLFILLSWTTSDGSISPQTLDWMDQTIEAHPNLSVVVCLHAYLYPYSLLNIKRVGSLSLTVPNAQEVWDHLDRHKNVVMTLSGHLHDNWVRIHINNGHEIWSISSSALKDEGYIRLFDVYEDRIEVRGYSPWTNKNYSGSLDHFTVNFISKNYDVDGDLWSDSVDIMPTEPLIPNMLVVGTVAFITMVGFLAYRIVKRRTTHRVQKSSNLNR